MPWWWTARSLPSSVPYGALDGRRRQPRDPGAGCRGPARLHRGLDRRLPHPGARQPDRAVDRLAGQPDVRSGLAGRAHPRRRVQAAEARPQGRPLYAQMLVGMVALTGQWWLDSPKMKKADVAAHLVNLAWNGLAGSRRSPRCAPRPPDGPADQSRRPEPAHRVTSPDETQHMCTEKRPGLVPGAASVGCCQPAVGGQAVAGLACTRGCVAGDSSRTRAAWRRPMMLRTKSRPDPMKAAMAANPAMRPMVSNA